MPPLKNFRWGQHRTVAPSKFGPVYMHILDTVVFENTTVKTNFMLYTNDEVISVFNFINNRCHIDLCCTCCMSANRNLKRIINRYWPKIAEI